MLLSYVDIVLFFQLLFQVIGMLVMFFAGILTIIQFILYQPWNTDTSTVRKVERLRVTLAQKIVFGLEFFIISDALATLVKPSLEELYRVAMIVAIRIALSYFISRELQILHRHGDQ